MRNKICLGFLVGMFAMSVGCGSGPTLTDLPGSISVDGAAPEGAVVMFHPTDPKDQVATAVATSNGSFRVNCNKQKGIPAGDYKVTVIWPDPSVKPTDRERMTGLAPDAPDLLEGKFATPQKTTLTMKVTDGMKELPPIEIKTK
jgi:hypothetical protein